MSRALTRGHGPTIVGLLVFAVALWAQTGAMVGVFYDDGIYVAIAKALAEGRGLVSLHLPGAPPAVHYPPLYPVALAGLWRLWPDFPANVVLFQLFDAAALGAATWIMVHHAGRTALPPMARYLALTIGVTAFPMLTLVGVRFSEPLFLALLAGAVCVADGDDVGPGKAVAAGVLAGLATLTRSIGVAAIVGIPLALLLRRRRGAAGVALIAALAVSAPWWLWLAAHGDSVDPLLATNYGTYTQYAGQAGVVGLLAGLDLASLQPFSRLLVPALPTPIWLAVTAMVSGAVVVGAVALARRVPTLLIVLVPYVGMVTLWPFTPDRFMWILLPWMALLATAGSLRAWQWGWWGRIPVLVLTTVIVVGFGWRQVVSVTDRQFAMTAERASRPFALLTAGIRTGTPENAIIASDGEAMIYLYTGRSAVPLFLFELEGRRMQSVGAYATQRYLCTQGVTHVATSWLGGDALPLLDTLGAGGSSVMTPLFTVVDGPALYRFRCPL